jgi:MFS family permease
VSDRLDTKNRDFSLFFAAVVISLLGDWFLVVALLDLVLELTGKASLATLVVVAFNLPVFLVSPWAGAQADRMDRRRLMITVDICRAVAALLPLLATTPGRLPLAYLGMALISLGSAYFDPAADAAVPNLVAKEDLGRANALLGSAWGTTMAAGSAIGGLVTTHFGRNTSIVVNSLSFVGSVLLLLLVKRRFSEAATSARPPQAFVAATREALDYARARPRVVALLLGKAGYCLAAGVVALLGVFGREYFAQRSGLSGPGGISALFVARGLGAVLGPFLLRGLARDGDRMNLAIAPCIMLFAAGYLLLSLNLGYAVSLACVLVGHMGGGAEWMASTYGLQREVPDELRGRIFAVDYGLATLGISLSSLVAGALADAYGAPRVALLMSCLSMTLAITWLFATYRLWDLKSR